MVKIAFESDYERMLRGYRCLSGINIPKDIIVKTKAEFDSFCSVRASLEYKIGREGKVLYERRQIDCDARQNRDAYQNVRCCSSGCRLDGTNGLSTPKPHLPPTVEQGLQD